MPVDGIVYESLNMVSYFSFLYSLLFLPATFVTLNNITIKPLIMKSFENCNLK